MSVLHTDGPLRCGLAWEIRRACLQRGWDQTDLARKSGVSRTTLYQIERGGVRKPRHSTLKRIAEALEMPVEDLSRSEPSPLQFDDRPSAATPRNGADFDRATNPLVDSVREERPELFAGWSAGQWDELYSTFGTGGQLTAEGVVRTAMHINRKREVVRRLNIVLETHLGEVAANLVETLYRSIQPGATLSACGGETRRASER